MSCRQCDRKTRVHWGRSGAISSGMQAYPPLLDRPKRQSLRRKTEENSTFFIILGVCQISDDREADMSDSRG
jgi:hypothetical protein